MHIQCKKVTAVKAATIELRHYTWLVINDFEECLNYSATKLIRPFPKVAFVADQCWPKYINKNMHLILPFTTVYDIVQL